jgi:hypothetical protein
MMRSSSQPENEIKRVPQAGVYSHNYSRDENIYLFTEMPANHELAELSKANAGRGCYLFIKDTLTAHFLDPNGQLERLPIDEEAVEKLIAEQPRKYQLSHGTELYLLANMPSDPVAAVRAHDEKEKDKNAVKLQYAYILSGDKLYFIDKAENRYLEVNHPDGIKKLKTLIGNEMLQPDEWAKLLPVLSAGQLAYLPLHDENIKKIKDETRPLQECFDKKKVEMLYHAVNACPGHTNGEYGIYRMVVSSKDYYSGELIDGLYGADEELSVLETIEKKIDEHIGSEHQIKEKTKKLLNEHEIGSGTLVDILSTIGVKVLETLLHSHSHASHGGGVAAAQYAMRRQLYKQIYIKPREGLTFNLAGRVPKDQMRYVNEHGSSIEMQLAKGGMPTTVDVWVVSSVDPRDIASTGFLLDTASNLSFVCFNQPDAEKLVANIKKFSEFHLKLLAFKPFSIDGHHANNAVDAVVSKEILLHAQAIFSVFNAVLEDYLKLHKGKPGAILHPILDLQLTKVDELVKLMEAASKLDANDPVFKNKVSQINQAIADLTQGLQDYVKTHPYQSPEHTFPISLLHHLAQFSESIEHIVVAAEKEVKKKASAHIAQAIFKPKSDKTEADAPKEQVRTEEKSGFKSSNPH